MSANIRWPKVVLFGDSITERSFESDEGCWGALLAHRLQRISDVIPRGFSGYNTRWCKIILPQLFPSGCDTSDITCFTIFLGANDSCLPQSQTKQHVPIEEYKQNLIDMVIYLQGIGISKEKIILITPPTYQHQEYVSFCKREGKPEPQRSAESVSAYANACSIAGQDCDVEVLNIHSVFGKAENETQLFSDGLHLSRKGAQLLFQTIWPAVEKRIKARENVDCLVIKYPYYADVDDNLSNLLP